MKRKADGLFEDNKESVWKSGIIGHIVTPISLNPTKSVSILEPGVENRNTEKT